MVMYREVYQEVQNKCPGEGYGVEALCLGEIPRY